MCSRLLIEWLRQHSRPTCQRSAGWLIAGGFILLTSFGQMGMLRAESDPSSPDLNQMSLAALGNVEVTTVSKEPEEVWQTPAAVYVLTQDDIRRSGATSIPEVLRLVPGVEVSRIDSDHWAIGIRGFESGFSKYALVLIDGRSVYTPLYEGVYWDVQNVMLEDVDRIEVIRGPGGTIWGANAVNGVINIIRKHSQDTDGTLFYAGSGNVDQGVAGSRYGAAIGAKFDYRTYALGFIRGAEYHSDHDPFDEWRLGQIGFRADWKAGERHTFGLEGDLYSGEEGERIGVGFFSPPHQANIDGTAFVSGGNLLAHWDHHLPGGSDLQIQAYFDRTNRQNLQLGETRNTFDFDVIHHLPSIKGQDLIWGVGARLSPSNFIQTQPTVNFSPHQETDSIYSGFIQDQVPLVGEKLFLTVGTKLEHNNYNGFDDQPSLHLLWRPGDRSTYWAAGTRAVRTPSRLDRDLSLIGYVETEAGYPIFIQIAGDPKFAPEKMIGYEAGYRRLVASRFYLDIATFFNNYNDVTSYGTPAITIQESPTPTPYPYILITEPWANGLIGNTDGGEISPDWKVTDRWRLRGSYSYAQMHLRDKAGITDTGTAASDIGSSPRHQAVLQSLLTLPGKIEFDPTYRFVSSLPAINVESYSSMDAHLSWRFVNSLELSGFANNLLAPHHVEYVSDPGPPIGIKRNIFVRLAWMG
jgi:iron complex outermembrane recepter protein